MTDAPDGRWVAKPPQPHRCLPPRKQYGDVRGPAGEPGWVWECSCGQRWTIVASVLYPFVKGGIFGPAWRKVEPDPEAVAPAPSPEPPPETERVPVWEAMTGGRLCVTPDGKGFDCGRGDVLLYLSGSTGRLMYDDAGWPEERRPLVGSDGLVEVLVEAPPTPPADERPSGSVTVTHQGEVVGQVPRSPLVEPVAHLAVPSGDRTFCGLHLEVVAVAVYRDAWNVTARKAGRPACPHCEAVEPLAFGPESAPGPAPVPQDPDRPLLDLIENVADYVETHGSYELWTKREVAREVVRLCATEPTIGDRLAALRSEQGEG